MWWVKAVKYLRARDPALGRVIKAMGSCRLKVEKAEPFAALAESILYQQLSGKAASTIVGRFKALYGGRWPTPKKLLATPAKKIRGVGISNAKMLAIQDLAKHAQRGELKLNVLEKMTDEALISHLDKIRGVGRWTAQMHLIFNLGRPDVFPVDDLGIQKAIQKLYGYKRRPAPRTMLKHAEAWRPYRSVASWYLWRILDNKAAIL